MVMQFSLASSLSLLFLAPLASVVSGQQSSPDSPALPVDKFGLVEIESRLTIKNATQVMNFVAVKHAVFASLRHMTKAKDDAEPERRPVLVAWKPDGTLLWTSEQPEAYKLAVTRDHVVLAYDAGYRDSERGLIWIDAETGKEARRVLLPGRPMLMRFVPELDLLIVFVMSAGRAGGSSNKDDVWLGALAYDLDGKAVWEWREKCHELAPLRVDAETIVVTAYLGNDRSVIGVSTKTGKALWRAPWDDNGAIEAPTLEKSFTSHRSLALLLCKKGVRFLDAGSGEPKGALPLPSQGYRKVWTTEQNDRLFFTSDVLDGITMAAYGIPSGKAIWSDETGTVSYAGPVAWGAETVFLARRLTGGLTGTISLTELRIYSPHGALVGHMPTVPLKRGSLYWDDTQSPQLVYGRLYVASDNAVVILRRK